ncbi:hypothetical protein E2562_026302 [Oryza meyeriana var. granulata]|uniref:Uncharacterized protein n=1 Tax=Oryza meyeriana var. granulata TaxID=110450 RepID=A0A6G1C8T3_9ORYZ|nr:hypothetical protein E2562_026302 [Oryza meyeriana var. granulata]
MHNNRAPSGVHKKIHHQESLWGLTIPKPLGDERPPHNGIKVEETKMTGNRPKATVHRIDATIGARKPLSIENQAKARINLITTYGNILIAKGKTILDKVNEATKTVMIDGMNLHHQDSDKIGVKEAQVGDSILPTTVIARHRLHPTSPHEELRASTTTPQHSNQEEDARLSPDLFGM